jgi:hypothetical protein
MKLRGKWKRLDKIERKNKNNHSLFVFSLNKISRRMGYYFSASGTVNMYRTRL